MKANKKTLLAFRKMMENEQEAYDYEGLIEQAVEDTKLLKSHEMGDYTLATDECGIVWCDQDVCVLAEFVDEYSRIFLDYILNMAESMIGEDIDGYFEDEE